jgi:integrase
MKGHIVKRAKGSYSIVVDLGRDEEGKRRQKWKTVTGTKRQAEDELHDLIHSLRKKKYIEPTRMTVGEYLRHWLDVYAKVNCSRETFARYEVIVNHLTKAFPGLKVKDLQPLQISKYYVDALTSGRRDGQGLSKRTIGQTHRMLHQALAHAVGWEMLISNPADAESVKAPKVDKKRIRALDEKETAMLLKLARGTRLYCPVVLAATTGMRRGEILGLTWKAIDFDRQALSVRQSLEQIKGEFHIKEPKSERSRRRITLSPLSLEALRAHKREQAKERLGMGAGYQNNDLVFARPDGAPWSPDVLTHGLSNLVRGTELEGITVHGLRHTHGAQMLRQGVHPKVASERLGHSTVSITLDIYSDVLPGLEEAAVLKVDEALRMAMSESGSSGSEKAHAP